MMPFRAPLLLSRFVGQPVVLRVMTLGLNVRIFLFLRTRVSSILPPLGIAPVGYLSLYFPSAALSHVLLARF